MVHEHAGDVWIVAWNMGQGKGELIMGDYYEDGDWNSDKPNLTGAFAGLVMVLVFVILVVACVFGAVYIIP